MNLKMSCWLLRIGAIRTLKIFFCVLLKSTGEESFSITVGLVILTVNQNMFLMNADDEVNQGYQFDVYSSKKQQKEESSNK